MSGRLGRYGPGGGDDNEYEDDQEHTRPIADDVSSISEDEVSDEDEYDTRPHNSSAYRGSAGSAAGASRTLIAPDRQQHQRGGSSRQPFNSTSGIRTREEFNRGRAGEAEDEEEGRGPSRSRVHEDGSFRSTGGAHLAAHKANRSLPSLGPITPKGVKRPPPPSPARLEEEAVSDGEMFVQTTEAELDQSGRVGRRPSSRTTTHSDPTHGVPVYRASARAWLARSEYAYHGTTLSLPASVWLVIGARMPCSCTFPCATERSPLCVPVQTSRSAASLSSGLGPTGCSASPTTVPVPPKSSHVTTSTNGRVRGASHGYVRALTPTTSTTAAAASNTATATAATTATTSSSRHT